MVLERSRPTEQASSSSSSSSSLGATKADLGWSPSLWRDFRCEQLPDYPDAAALAAAEENISGCAPLVFAGEMRELQRKLAQAQQGNGFLLMGGDCAESFDEFCTDHVRDTLRVILQMALVITHGSSLPVIKIGRMAGQFAKPRSSGMETRVMDDGSEVSLPSYKGDNVNSQAFTKEARTPNPELMVKAYHQGAQTINILRAFTKGGTFNRKKCVAQLVYHWPHPPNFRTCALSISRGLSNTSAHFKPTNQGYADIGRLQSWNLDFAGKTPQGSNYRQIASKVEESLRFMRAIGVDTSSDVFTKTDFYVAHECLLLQYEEALTRRDSLTGRWYDCSAHMLWVGERTRQLDCGHLQFVRGLGNPVGVKVSDKCEDDELIELLDIINPENAPGRVTLIIRMGAGKIREHLPRLVKAVTAAGKHVLWISDPVHGNTISANGYKTRPLPLILDEILGFMEVHRSLGTHPGGVHLEMTGESVTECLGGSVDEVTEQRLVERYVSSSLFF